MAEFGNLPTIEPVVEKLDGKTVVTLGTVHFTEGNAAVRAALEDADVVELRETFAQRYLGCGMPVGKRLEIHGVPGNDMACYMDGGEIEVFGNAQDQVANTMNDGDIVIHGRVGDAAGYGMRGGRILVRDGCGWRVGIHMKQYGDKAPAIVIGGDAGSFLGEYQAGGLILVLGLHTDGRPVVHFFPCTGMHGGKMVFRGDVSNIRFPDQVSLHSATAEDMAEIRPYVQEYARLFGRDADALRCKLPSGRILSYWGADLGQDGHLYYMGQNQTTRKWERTETWGGKLVENIVQAVARDCLAVALLRLDDAGFQTLFTVHDEVIVEEPQGRRTWQDVAEIMGQPIEWAPGLLLRGDGYETSFYMKD